MLVLLLLVLARGRGEVPGARMEGNMVPGRRNWETRRLRVKIGSGAVVVVVVDVVAGTSWTLATR
jgi:hypothetical protein